MNKIKYNQNLLRLLKRKAYRYSTLVPILDDLRETEYISWGQVRMIEKVLKGDINEYLLLTEYKPYGKKCYINNAHNKIYSTLRELSGRVHYRWEKENRRFWINEILFTYDESLINGKIYIYVEELNEILFKEVKRNEI